MSADLLNRVRLAPVYCAAYEPRCTCPTDAEIDAAIAANYRPAKPEGDTDV